MAENEYIVNLRIVSASHLPVTDGKQTSQVKRVYPYVFVHVNGRTFRTQTVRENINPVYDELFFPVIKARRSCAGTLSLSGILIIWVYSRGTFRDSVLCMAKVSIAAIQSPNPYSIDVPLHLSKERYKVQGVSPFVTIRFEGWTPTYATLKQQLSAPNVIFDPKAKAIYRPLPGLGGRVYLGVEYDPKRSTMDVALYLTACVVGQPIYLNIVSTLDGPGGGTTSTVHRRTFEDGLQIAPGLTAYEEVRIRDLPWGFRREQIRLTAHEVTRLDTITADKVVQEHGWRGALSFMTAASVLYNVSLDMDQCEIYMLLSKKHWDAVVIVNYNEDDPRVKLAVLDCPSNKDELFDLTLRSRGCHRSVTSYSKPQQRLEGLFPVGRMLQIEDLSYGTHFRDICLSRIQLAEGAPLTDITLAELLGESPCVPSPTAQGAVESPFCGNLVPRAGTVSRSAIAELDEEEPAEVGAEEAAETIAAIIVGEKPSDSIQGLKGSPSMPYVKYGKTYKNK